MNKFKKLLKQQLQDYLLKGDFMLGSDPLDANVMLEASRTTHYVYEKVRADDCIMHVLKPENEKGMYFCSKEVLNNEQQ